MVNENINLLKWIYFRIANLSHFHYLFLFIFCFKFIKPSIFFNPIFLYRIQQAITPLWLYWLCVRGLNSWLHTEVFGSSGFSDWKTMYSLIDPPPFETYLDNDLNYGDESRTSLRDTA
jgi:hypothetical protein